MQWQFWTHNVHKSQNKFQSAKILLQKYLSIRNEAAHGIGETERGESREISSDAWLNAILYKSITLIN